MTIPRIYESLGFPALALWLFTNQWELKPCLTYRVATL
jgi:hypothetical protein